MSAPTTPERAIKRKEADTVKKTRFFEAFDSHTRAEEPLESLAAKFDITERTAYKWLRQRRIRGSSAYRRSRKVPERLSRKSKLTNEQIRRLLSPSNPVRNQHYEYQIHHFNLPCTVRTLQRILQKRTKHARRYKAAPVKLLSSVNKAKRKKYGQEHQDKSIDEFWANIYWTDEAHIDPTETFQQYILREQGT